MRKRIKTSAGWIHTTLILALIIPLLYAVIMEDPTVAISHLYLKCLVIALPVVVTDFAADRCRSLLSYLTVSALTCVATGMTARVLTGNPHGSGLLSGYFLLIFLETLFVIVSRLHARLRKKTDREAAKAADPTFYPFHDILKEPSFLVLPYFGLVYILAVNLNSPSLCNAALFSVLVYVPATFLYQYVDKTENYLSLNKRTCRLPSKRIYVVKGGILAVYLLILLVFALPSLLTISHRHYRDLRKMAADLGTDYAEIMPEPGFSPAGEDPLAAALAEYGEPTPPPWWIDFLFQTIAALLFLILAIALMRKVYTVFQDFRTAVDENGDLVEDLQDKAADIRKIQIPASRQGLSEKERIRKKYRKLIRRHRKDRPAVYESPSEMEEKAGIAKAEETVTLHAQYELARYGEE